MDLTKDLEIARDTVVASLDGLDDAQWRFRPAPECWSIAEIAEHVTLVSREIGLMVRGPLLQAPVDEDHPAGEGLVRSRLLSRARKVRSPERFVPKGTWLTVEEVRREFLGSREALLEWLRAADAPLRAHRLPHPMLGPLDGVEWLAFLAAHDLRHVAQIDEAKRAVGYPAVSA
jgi:hypothetical protein